MGEGGQGREGLLVPADSDSNTLACLDVGSLVSRGEASLTPTDHTVTGSAGDPWKQTLSGQGDCRSPDFSTISTSHLKGHRQREGTAQTRHPESPSLKSRMLKKCAPMWRYT